MANIGMMNEAYFVSKNVLIDWINNFLQIRIEKVEHCATGAIYCQLFDAIHPGSIKMSRVDFTVKHEYEYTKNWKLLQNAFNQIGIKKSIPVQRLVKARYQDNLEFLQWMYKYSKDTYNGDIDRPTYNGIGRRNKSKGGKEFNGLPLQLKNNNNKNKRNNNMYGSKRNSQFNNSNNNSRALSSNISNNTSHIKSNTNNNNRRTTNNNSNNNMYNNTLLNTKFEEIKKENIILKNEKNILNNKLNDMNKEYENLVKTAGDIEKERDFYFEKVLKVEQICKEYSDQTLPVLTKIYNLLYQNDDNNNNDSNIINKNNSNINDTNVISNNNNNNIVDETGNKDDDINIDDAVSNNNQNININMNADVNLVQNNTLEQAMNIDQ